MGAHDTRSVARVNRFSASRATPGRGHAASAPRVRCRRCRSASRCSPPSASRGPRPAASATSSTRWPGRSAGRARRDVDGAGRRLPAALPQRARSRPTRSSRTTTRPRPGPARAGRASATVTIVDVAADGYRLRLVDHPAAFDRDGLVRRRRRRRLRRQRLALRAVLPGRARGAPGGAGAAGRRPPSPRLAHRAGRDLPRRALRRRPDHRPGGDRHHAPQPRLPRLDAADGARPARARAGRRRRRRPTPTGSTCCARGSSGPSSSTRSRPGSPREALTPEPSGWASTARCAAKGDRFVGILNGLDTDGLGSGDRRRPGGAVLARRPARARRPAGRTCSTRLGFDPDDDGRGARDDRAARSAEGLRPARATPRRRCSSAGARIVVQG